MVSVVPLSDRCLQMIFKLCVFCSFSPPALSSIFVFSSLFQCCGAFSYAFFTSTVSAACSVALSDG